MVFRILLEAAISGYLRERCPPDHVLELRIVLERWRIPGPPAHFKLELRNCHILAVDLSNDLAGRGRILAAHNRQTEYQGESPREPVAIEQWSASMHEAPMETLYDWWAVATFGVLSITWLSRSVNRTSFPDPALPYAICALGCALGNWLGNEGHSVFAAAVLSATLIVYLAVIRPFRKDQD